MGITVNATEAAKLAGVTERTMRAWLAAGRIPGARKQQEAAGKGPASWEIDSDQLAAVPGVQIDRNALALIETRAGRAPAGILARLDSLEAQMRLVLTRLRAIESALAVNAPIRAAEGASAAWRRSDMESYSPPTYTPPAGLPSASPASRGSAVVPGGHFRTHADAARWLVTHAYDLSALTPRTWPGWKEVELMPRAVLALAVQLCDTSNHRILWRLHTCSDPSCVCQEMLGAPASE